MAPAYWSTFPILRYTAKCAGTSSRPVVVPTDGSAFCGDLQFEFRALQCRVSVSREFAFLMSRSRAFPAGVCGPGCLADGQKRRRGGRMIVTSRVRESCRGRLVTPLDAAARWNGRGDKGEAA